jgi:hypothetical protein
MQALNFNTLHRFSIPASTIDIKGLPGKPNAGPYLFCTAISDLAPHLPSHGVLPTNSMLFSRY